MAQKNDEKVELVITMDISLSRRSKERSHGSRWSPTGISRRVRGELPRERLVTTGTSRRVRAELPQLNLSHRSGLSQRAAHAR